MPSRAFDDRVAAIEEHLVSEEPAPEHYLCRAEEELASGNESLAGFWLNMAKIRSNLNETSAMLDELEDEDDA